MSHTLPPLIVHSLICRQHVAMGIKCLSTLFRCSDRAIDLHLHDDGSLTPEDTSALRAAFPTVTLISREEADQLAYERLRPYPRCLEFRRNCSMTIKLFDPLLAGQDSYLLLDTDILFFNAFENLFDAPKGCAIIYMEDYVYSYALRPWDMIAHKDLRAIRGLNAGMMFVQANQIDLEFIEYLYRKGPRLTSGHPGEQTTWAILANKLGARKWNPKQVSIVNDRFQVSADQIAAHFVSPSRHRLDDFAANISSGSPGRRVRAQLEEADTFNAAGMSYDYLQMTIHNRLYLLRSSLASRP